MVTGATVETAVRRTTTAIALFKKHAAPSAATLSLAQLQALMVELAATRESRMQDVPGYLAEHPPKALPVGFDELVRVYNSYVDWIIVKETAALPAAPAPAKPAPATSDASNPSAALAAIGEGDADALEELLGAGLSANVTLDGGSSLLLAATEAGSTDCVEVLIKAGAAVGFARAADGCTALHAAAMASQMEVVELLLGHGANVHAKSSAGKTAAELATHADITSLLGEASESMPADMPSTDGADAKLLGADAAQSLKFRVNSGGHRRGSVSAERVDPLSAGGKKKVVDKSDADKARIETSLMKSFLFKHADAGQRADLVNAMYEVRKPKGADVIKQGDREANEFFLIDSGECDIYKRFGDDPVEKKLVTFGVGAAFGELALMYNTPRAASVRVASDEVVLWAMDRDSFKTIVLFNTMEKRMRYESFLEQVELLKELSSYERATIADSLAPRNCAKGETVISQGEIGDEIFFLLSGTAEAFVASDDGPKSVLKYDGAGAYFGELALLNDEPRKATVKTTSDCELVALDRAAFERLLGPVVDVLKRNTSAYSKFLAA